jgi:hypothetical protein
MRKNTIISKIIGLVMLISVFSAHIASASYVPQLDSKTSDSEKKDKTPSVFQQISHETVVPSYDFYFGEFHLVFVENCLFGYEENTPLAKPDYAYHSNSYFEKLFEHHIAINAP